MTKTNAEILENWIRDNDITSEEHIFQLMDRAREEERKHYDTKHNERLKLLREYNDGNYDLTDCIKSALRYIKILEKSNIKLSNKSKPKITREQVEEK